MPIYRAGVATRRLRQPRQRDVWRQPAQPTYAQPLVLDHAPAGYWKCNDNGGTTLTDSSGNARHGTLAGTYSQQQAALDGFKGTKFTASGSGLASIPHNTAFNLSVQTGALWTLLLDGRWDAAGSGFPTIIGKGDTGLGTPNGWYVNIATTPGNLQFGINGVDSTHQLVTAAGWTTVSWKRAVLTCIGRTVSIYANGALLGSKTFGADYAVTSTAPLMLARNDYAGATGYSDVSSAEVAIVQGYAYSAADVTKDWTEASTGALQGAGGVTPTSPGEVIPTTPSGPTAPAAGWVDVFGEDFDAATIDWTRFDPQYRQGAVIGSSTPGWTGPTGLWGTNPSNSELSWALPANVSTRNGRAVLRAQQQTVLGADGNSYGYTTGMLSTYPLASFNWSATRTFVEVRRQFATGKGLWGNTWLASTDLTLPPEIDIAAAVGDTLDTVYSNIRYVDAGGVTQSALVSQAVTGSHSSEHTYGIDLDAPGGKVTWYVDGVQVRQITDAAVIAALAAKPMYLLCTLAVGGTWPTGPAGEPGGPDPSTVWPVEALIDYVHIWQDAAVIAGGGTSGGGIVIPAAPSGPSGTWVNVMADAFTGATLDRKLWGYGETFGGSSDDAPGANTYESGKYRRDGTGVALTADGLVLTATPLSSPQTISGRTCYYVTGGVKTSPYKSSDVGWTADVSGTGASFRPGDATLVFEFLAQMDPTYAQAFFAFWLRTVDLTWPPEADGQEMMAGASDRGRPRGTIHAGSSDSLQALIYQTSASDPKWGTGLHKFTIQMGMTGVFAWIDGVSQGAGITDSTKLNAVFKPGGTSKDFALVCNLSTVGAPGATQMQAKVRYICVWRKSTDSGGVTGGGTAAGTVLPS